MSSYLIADSGGTRTDWCFIDAKLERHYFETESYHPENWSDDFLERNIEYWRQHPDMRASKLLFYGAGCLKQSNAVRQTEILRKMGFKDIRVRSDLHAAGLACLGNRSGTVAILGTGSVLFEWKEGTILNVIGGKGHESGDEGSGYYFGKLVHNAYIAKQLTEEQNRIFLECIDLSVTKVNAKSEMSHIAYLLKDQTDVFAAFHRLNVREFYAKHLNGSNVKNIYVIGGYAYHNASIIAEEWNKYDTQVVKIIKTPISELVEQIVALNE